MFRYEAFAVAKQNGKRTFAYSTFARKTFIPVIFLLFRFFICPFAVRVFFRSWSWFVCVFRSIFLLVYYYGNFVSPKSSIYFISQRPTDIYSKHSISPSKLNRVAVAHTYTNTELHTYDRKHFQHNFQENEAKSEFLRKIARESTLWCVYTHINIV